MGIDRRDLTRDLKLEAARLGFSFSGVAKADFLEDEAPRLERWLAAGMHGRMGYMANWFDKRLDPRKLVPGARSVVSLLYNHHHPGRPKNPDAPRISQYAFGEDYHFVLKRKLKELMKWLEARVGAIEGRVFVDSAPVLERAWAARSGNGWVGKNSMLIHPRAGSWFFLAELILDLDLEPDGPMKDYCGTCRACIDACPTDAITEDQVVDGSRCISYFTIELKDAALPEELREAFGNWAFGCDICQEVCPWNRFSTRHEEPAFEPHPELLEWTREQWMALDPEAFRKLFRHSAVKRTKFSGLRRNLDFLNASDSADDLAAD